MDALSTQAPEKVLEKYEVWKILGMQEDALDSLIAKGEFPQGIPWSGRSKRWLPSDVEWFFLHRKVLARLVVSESEAEEVPAGKSKR
jgi:predicted DNA-binding transcriptional regulator AlpA